MTLNPLHFAHEVNLQYLRYQVTSARLSDPLLAKQLKDQLWKGDSPLIKGPFVSLNRPFKEGNTVRELVGNRTLHPRVAKAIPFPRLYAHQEQALKLIQEGRDVLITTGTGSGKTEAFLYPIVDPAAWFSTRERIDLHVERETPNLTIHVKEVHKTAEGDSTDGRLALLIADGFFDAPVNSSRMRNEFRSRGWGSWIGGAGHTNALKLMRRFAEWGFLRESDGAFQIVPEAKARVRVKKEVV